MAILYCQCTHADHEHLLMRASCLANNCECIVFIELRKPKKKESKKK